MPFLLFLGALVAIVVFATVVNRLTGTKAQYLEALSLTAGEKELWRDTAADFVSVPKLGAALVMSFPRRRRHSVVWTERRVVVAQKVLFSSKRMITHQVFFQPREAAGEFFGGFYGRGFLTIIATKVSFAHVDGKDCARIEPTAESGDGLNTRELLVFTDRLGELRERLAPAPD